MFKKIAQQLNCSLDEPYLSSLEAIRNYISSQTKSLVDDFTDHSVTHSDAIQSMVVHVLVKQEVMITDEEGYILLAAIYLHDIGLSAGELLKDERGSLPIECWPHDVRRQHARLSEAIVLSRELQDKIGFNHEMLPYEFATPISILCRFHDSINQISEIPEVFIVFNRRVRLRLLAAFLFLGDALHIGKDRVRIEKLIKAPLTLKSRMFWYSYWCISTVEITKEIITLKLLRSKEYSKESFYNHVFLPALNHFQWVFKLINPVLEQNQINPLALNIIEEASYTSIVPSEVSILGTSLLENEIRQRNAQRKKFIENKIKKNGLISNNKINNELVILRRWGSFTPRMPKWNQLTPHVKYFDHESRGGGYFLVWRKTGIVIDPGYDFLRNFWSQRMQSSLGFELEDINCVFMSHAHDDHSHDIEPILSLCHKRQKLTSKANSLRLYMSEGTHIKYERLLTINNYISVTDLIPSTMSTYNTLEDGFLQNRGISVQYMRSLHNEMPWIKNHTGVAMKFILEDGGNVIKIGFTSDTRYFTELVNFFNDVDILLLHFGNLGPLETSDDPYDKNHLGLNGCHDLINNLVHSGVKLFLLDEFGEEEIGNDRIKLCSLLSGMCSLNSHNKVLLPMDIGMRIRLPSMEVYCQEHDHFVPHDKIVPHLPDSTEGIVYYC